MVFRQIVHDDLGCASYLIGDEHAGVAAVVDPRFEIGAYLELARYVGVEIEHVLETHTHADHLSGHGRLAAATGATIHIHRGAGAEYEHHAFDDGWELELGSVHVRAIHTPGHRPEHTAFALTETGRGDDPWAVLTGDTLFVGDVARPDLAVEKAEGARAMFRTLHDRLLTLAPETEVWPGHLGGSLCGGPGMDMKVSSTIGYELRHNDLLREDDEDRFVERAISGLAPQPPNFQAIVGLNRGPLVTGGADPLPLTPRQLEAKRREGALIVDVRTDLQFDDAHVPGSVSNTMLRSGFGTKLAWIADRGQEIVFVGRDDADGHEAAKLAVAVGVRNLGGYLTGGLTSWRAEGRDVERIVRVDVRELHALTDAESDGEVQILDVREENEWHEARIPGSVHEPYHDIHAIPDGIDPEKPVAAICMSGQRSAVAASLLQRLGARRVLHVVPGGVGTWKELGYPIENGR
ncbi:MAG TPA: MBL fold metallo-hydrolase [Thermoleophilaceae bacterium]|jgi:glyoxylase-like metal-dependent hydrolase (beta-lactamase superfamily II)/rhodanese-related sulfurtransferase